MVVAALVVAAGMPVTTVWRMCFGSNAYKLQH